MKRIRIFFLNGIFALCFFGMANAQDLSQATEFFNKGAEAIKAKDYATALQNFEQALNLAQKLGDEGAEIVKDTKASIPSLYLFLGQELAKAKNIDAAMVELKKAMEAAKQYQDTGNTITEAKELIDQLDLVTANDLLNEKKFPEAIAAYKKILESNPNNGVVYQRIGMAYTGSGNETEAVAAYQKAIANGQKEAGAQLSNIYLKNAQAAMKEKKWAGVLDNAKKAMDVNESNVNANYFYGAAAVQLKKFNDAIAPLEKVLSASPSAAIKTGSIYNLAVAYEGLGKNSQACGYYKQLLTDATYKQIADHKIKNVLKCQ